MTHEERERWERELARLRQRKADEYRKAAAIAPARVGEPWPKAKTKEVVDAGAIRHATSD